MKKFENISELLGQEVLVDHDWFRPKSNSLGHYQWFNVNTIINSKKLVISEDVPYGSTNTRLLETIINNYDKLEEKINNRLYDKKEYKDAAIIFIAKVDLNYGTRILVDYARRYNDEDIIKSLIDKGYKIIKKGTEMTIYSESVELLVKQLKIEKVFDKYFFELKNTPQFTTQKEAYSVDVGTVIISPSTRQGVLYQITLFKGEKPYGHLNISSDKELNYWIDNLELEVND
ncbi:hypothetical protein L2Z53_11875 (plasmid) [Macrococcoides canis]|uniref:hypothetical protein n=1 Tax=Macrococcoides canis TaxID=1855823 RepID=UPI001F16D753|nr:hypothetical protein [Macrococcus canis]UJS29033.1 hypothetical protein L2Z53_11875 [Macrococcus canis]